ncbi:MAG TPA: hypothetical protein ACFYEK_09055 [Candidatus Wunengus sp. YC60]
MQDGWPASPHHIAAAISGRAVGSAETFLLSPCITPESIIAGKKEIST